MPLRAPAARLARMSTAEAGPVTQMPATDIGPSSSGGGMRRVSFFCVGAQKCGTTALHNYLNRHSDIALPSLKETHFFDDGHGEWSGGVQAYLAKYFAHASPTQVLGEIDPEYLFFPEMPRRLAAAFPEAKLIFMFREPVARAYSHYWMTVRRGRESLPFAEAIAAEPARLAAGGHLEQSDFSYFSRGLYYAQVGRYLECFPREQMLFILSEDLKGAPEATLQSVYAFLGVPTPPYEPITDVEAHHAYMPVSRRFQELLEPQSRVKRVAKKLFPASIRRPLMDVMWRMQDRNRKPFEVPTLDAAFRVGLQALYAADIEALAGLIGRDLSAWLD